MIIRSAATLQFIVGVAMLLSSLAELENIPHLAEALFQYRVFGSATGLIIASLLPWVKLTLAVCLLSGLLVRASLLLSLVVFLGSLTAEIRAAAGNIPEFDNALLAAPLTRWEAPIYIQTALLAAITLASLLLNRIGEPANVPSANQEFTA